MARHNIRAKGKTLDEITTLKLHPELILRCVSEVGALSPKGLTFAVEIKVVLRDRRVRQQKLVVFAHLDLHEVAERICLSFKVALLKVFLHCLVSFLFWLLRLGCVNLFLLGFRLGLTRHELEDLFRGFSRADHLGELVLRHFVSALFLVALFIVVVIRFLAFFYFLLLLLTFKVNQLLLERAQPKLLGL
jgi:hypothetical protein